MTNIISRFSDISLLCAWIFVIKKIILCFLFYSIFIKEFT